MEEVLVIRKVHDMAKRPNFWELVLAKQATKLMNQKIQQ